MKDLILKIYYFLFDIKKLMNKETVLNLEKFWF
jgi:hypothetical protein